MIKPINVLPGFDLWPGLLGAPAQHDLARRVEAAFEAAPPARYETAYGKAMSVAMTSFGPLGWTSDKTGYRYADRHPGTGRPWPPMPQALLDLWADLGDAGTPPDSALVNLYRDDARMGLHQDRDEQDYGHPIVSVSLGMPATFLFGGLTRAERPQRILLEHGDVVVWGGTDRLRFHGVATLKDHPHPALGSVRLNLTFRHAGS